MTDLNEPRLLAQWLEAHPGEPPPEGVETEVMEAVYALRPDLAPAPRVTVEDILAVVASGPFVQASTASDDEEAADFETAFGGALAGAWGEDIEIQLDATFGQDAPAEETPDEGSFDEGSFDEVALPDSDEVPEVTPVLGSSGTDPLVHVPEEATDPGLSPIAEDLLEENTSPSGRQPAFGIVEAPAPPKPDDTASMMAPPVEPPPSLRNRAVRSPTPDGPLSKAGLPTGPTRVRSEPTRSAEPEPSSDSEATDPVIESPVGAEVVDLASHSRWRSRRVWATAGTLLAAALALVVFVPTLQQMPGGPEADLAMRRSAPSSPRAAARDELLGEPPPPPAEAEVPLDAPPEVVGTFSPNQRLGAPTRAVGVERKKSDLQASTGDDMYQGVEAEPAAASPAAPGSTFSAGRSSSTASLAKDRDGEQRLQEAEAEEAPAPAQGAPPPPPPPRAPLRSGAER